MKYSKTLSLAFTLMFVLVTAVFGETSPPPCSPGETLTPPCISQPMNDDAAAQGQTPTPPEVPQLDVTDITETVLRVLSLF